MKRRMNNRLFYSFPYIIAKPKGYIKNYYAKGEWTSCRIGGGGLLEIDMNDNQELLASHKERSIKLFADVMECLGAQAVVETSPLQFLYSWKQVVYPETDCYWYHPDHLGSSSWITYTDGSTVEHLHYMPWGEDFVRQRSTNWYAMYTFSAKEKDIETGYSYFGSRYYSSDLSIWLSVDPMSDKYPHQSNYIYCSNNPIIIIDPNGEDEYEFDGKGNLNWVRTSDFDSFHKVDENGHRTGESCEFEGIVVSNQFNLGEKHVSSYLQINNSQDAMDLFSFISDNVENDGAEFSISLVQDKNGDFYNLIGSDKNAKAGETYSIPNLLNCDDYTVLKTVHNHYAGKKSPSGSDVDYAKKFPNTIFMIRTAGDVFTPYDKNTTPNYDFGTPDVVIPLKPVEIPINKN